MNLFKSKLFGFNLMDEFLQATSSFLTRGIGSIPFMFLGIPVGVNPRKRATWNFIGSKVIRRLSSWQIKHLSIEGRVIILNIVVTNILIYLFSF